MAEGTLRQVDTVILCGLPGSGKTYLSSLIEDKVLNDQLLSEKGKIGCFVVCYDDWMSVVDHSKFSENSSEFKESSEWKQSRKSIHQTVEQLITEVRGTPGLDLDHRATKQFKYFFKKLQNATLSQKQNVIFLIDDNMHLKSMRFEYFQLARKYNIGFCQIYVKCDPSMAVIRNASRDVRVPEPVIIAMAEKIETPQPQKNSWERRSLVIADDTDKFESCWCSLENLLRDAFDNPVHPLEDHEGEKSLSREVCSTSILHQADQALRKLLSETMKTADKSSIQDLKQLSLRLNAARQHVLTGVKAGEICIPRTILIDVESGDVQKIQTQLKLFLKEEMDRWLDFEQPTH